MTQLIIRASVLALLVGGFAGAVSAGEPAESSTGAAYAGDPFGVCRWDVITAKEFTTQPDRPWSRLKEKNGRVLYPVFRRETARGDQISRTDRVARCRRLTAQFLFRGNKPLELEWTLPDGRVIEKTISPRHDLEDHTVELNGWWAEYKDMAQANARNDAYPPQIENYLASMLSERLELSAPKFRNPWSGREDLDAIFGGLMGAESVRVAMQRKTLLKSTSRREVADRDLPKAVTPPAVTIPKFDEGVVIEPMAMHVPRECFYLRCGSFGNFRWLRALVDQWGTAVRDLVAVRGMDYGIRRKLELQLALRETVLSKLFGDQLISDVAVIGTDTFFREGAAWGVIFESRNNALLTTQINNLRAGAMKKTPGATGETVKIAGRDVALISTPDNRIRSFYAVDGDYHLVCTSREIVRRFFEAGQGKEALGGLKEFRYARSLMPVDEEHAAFVYLSDNFFRNIIGPKYRIEMTRRMEAQSEIELVHLAQLAAKAEGLPHETIHQLMKGEFLPSTFHIRPDGTRAVMEQNTVTDSLRGARGFFTPVPDVDVEKATASEVASYEKFSRFYRSQWEQVDPAIFAIKRRPHEKHADREHVTVDVHITPYARRHYGMLQNYLGVPLAVKALPLAGDIGSVTVSFGKAWFARQLGFAGMQDSPKGDDWFTIKNGRVFDPGQPQLYYGLLAQGGFKEFLEKKEPKEMEASIMGIYPGGNDELQNTKVKIVRTKRPAQIRLTMGELRKLNIASLIKAGGYLQARRASASNTLFFETLIQQLNIDPQTAPQVAERILGASSVCPLEGEYRFNADAKPMAAWESSMWKTGSYHEINGVPADYEFPFLEFFRGVELEFNIDATTLSSHVEFDVRKTIAN